MRAGIYKLYNSKVHMIALLDKVTTYVRKCVSIKHFLGTFKKYRITSHHQLKSKPSNKSSAYFHIPSSNLISFLGIKKLESSKLL